MTKAEQILTALGGDANIIDLEPCITRLRVEVIDPTLVNEAALKTTGAFGTCLWIGLGPLPTVT